MRASPTSFQKKPIRRMTDIRSVRKRVSLPPEFSDASKPKSPQEEQKTFSPIASFSPISSFEPEKEEHPELVTDVSRDSISDRSVFLQPSFRDRLASWWFALASRCSFFSEEGNGKRYGVAIALAFFLLGSAWFGVRLFEKGMDMKARVLGASTEGYGEISQAIEEVKRRDFESSGRLFREASVSFSTASDFFDGWNESMFDVAQFIPFVSRLSSGKYLLDAASDIAIAGEIFSRIGSRIASLGNPLENGENISFLDVFRSVRADAAEAERLLSLAAGNLGKVAVSDLPEDKRAKFLQLKTALPEAISGLRLFLEHGDIFSDMLGGNGSRKFLFLFQNNQELRATGGFIGSYAFLDVNNGRVRKFFVDGIFNPDGQIHEDIVPPLPIQKISAGWSLHDSNWFPDFPLSAEKAIHFYEKTDGPTVDGVIAFTPEVLKRFLSITGPIAMEKYGATVDEQNFLETIQYQVEVAYDKKENKPKQILSDLAPIVLERVFGEEAPPGAFGKALASIESGLSEKHILFYSRNADMQRLISDVGWSGEVLFASRDYASVIHSNINGYKTDGILDEAITHRADIQGDGSIIDTIVIQRTHRGGNTGREWWDKVNADYMRVYVPLGSVLLSADGHTRETVLPPLDYSALRFSRDPDVAREENGTRIDPTSGTRISEDSGKTVFGNWVYVSPGETVTVTYTYLLPFRVDPGSFENSLDAYSMVFQKQSGSRGSALSLLVSFPDRFRSVWQSDENLIPCDGGRCLKTDLVFDRFVGLLFSEKP